MRRTLLAIVIAGCASAGKPGFGERPDAGIHLVPDAATIGPGRDGSITPPIDAPTSGGEMTLSQTTDQTDTQIAIACGNNLSGFTGKNSYYRVFALSDYGIAGGFDVTAVHFVVSNATSGPVLKVSVGTYGGAAGGQTLTASQIHLIANAMITPSDTATATVQDVPLAATIPAGSDVIVEVDQTNAGSATNPIQFYIGANPDGETKPGYIMAADCGVAAPSSMSQQAGAETDLVLWATGTAQ